MFAGFDQALSAQRAMFKTFADLSTQALNGAQKIAELNIQTAKTSVAEGVEQFEALAQIKDPSKLSAFGAQFAQPATEKASAYAKHLYEITSTTGNGIAATLQAQAAEAQIATSEWIEVAAKNAPAGTEPLVNAAKSAVAMYQGAYDKAVLATNQAVAKATEFAEKAVPSKAKARR